MIYRFRAKNYNRNKVNNIINILNWRNKSKFPSERYSPHKFTPITQSNQKFPYLNKESKNNILNKNINSNQLGNKNPFYNDYFSKEYNPRFNLKKEDLNSELPLINNNSKHKDIIETSQRIENKNYKLNKGIKKNKSNFNNSNIKNLPKINPLEEKREVLSDKIIKRNRTEEQLNSRIIDKISEKNWWKLLKHFVEIYSFLSILRKYSFIIKKIRYKEIIRTKKNIIEEALVVRNWLIEIEGNFWDNLLKFKNINIAFKESDKFEKIEFYSKIIIQFIDEFFNNLKIKINNIQNIPDIIQKIIYKYIKKNAYYPSKYLNVFHIKRLSFDFYGSCVNNTIEESAMNLSYLLISNISVQQIFLNIKYVFEELKDYENILIASKYIASIIYYLERNAFAKIKKNNNYIDLFNYFRCYRIKNDIIEKECNIEALLGIVKTTNILKYKEYLDNDIYYKLLIDDKIIDKFWQLNSNIMKKISNSLFIWSLNVTKLILNKFDKKNKYHIEQKKSNQKNLN